MYSQIGILRRAEMGQFNDLFASEFEIILIRGAQEIVYANNWRHRSVILECNMFRYTFYRLYSAGFFLADQKPSLSEREWAHFNEMPKEVQTLLDTKAKTYLQSCPFHKNR